jgi:uncharacterized protein YbaA (DUF1428 family)
MPKTTSPFFNLDAQSSFSDIYEMASKRNHMKYVDGYVLPVPKKNLAAYRRMAQKAGKVWREHGALEFRECVGDDLKTKVAASFPETIKLKAGETVVFSWIMFKSRAHRDSVNAKVMKDPRLAKMMDMKSMPFDSKRMVYGGFKTMVDL